MHDLLLDTRHENFIVGVWVVEDMLEQVRDLEKRRLLCLKMKNKDILIFTFNSSESELKEANCRKVLNLKFLFLFQACFPFFF